MKLIDADTSTSTLLEIKIGEEISDGKFSGYVAKIDFEETNNYWEAIFSLINGAKIYIRKHKTSC